MSELNIGDRIQAGTNVKIFEAKLNAIHSTIFEIHETFYISYPTHPAASNGSIKYTEVESFLKEQPSVIVMYQSIQTSSDKDISCHETTSFMPEKVTLTNFMLCMFIYGNPTV